MSSPFWQKQVCLFVFIGWDFFVFLTVAAMLGCPGGLSTGELTSGYNFFGNFFSDLGRTVVSGQTSNTFSVVLFFAALSTAGIGLVFFLLHSVVFQERPYSEQTQFCCNYSWCPIQPVFCGNCICTV